MHTKAHKIHSNFKKLLQELAYNASLKSTGIYKACQQESIMVLQRNKILIYSDILVLVWGIANTPLNLKYHLLSTDCNPP